MKVSHKHIMLQEILYYMFFSVLLFAKGIGLYEGMLSFNICILLALACMAGAMVLTDYSIQEWIGIFAVLACGFVAYRISGEKATIITCLVVIGMKNIPLERIMKLAFAIWTITFYGMLFVHLAGWKEEIVLAHNKFGLGFLLRHSLGFPHPNVLHISFVIWMALFLYVFRFSHKRLIKVSLFLTVENIFIFFYSISITGFALGFMYLILNYYFYRRKELIWIEKTAIKLVLPLCILVSVIPPLFFEGKLYDFLNKLLNSRMNIWRYYLTTFMPGVFGTRVYSPEYAILSLDCSYLYLLYYYGIILFTVIIGLIYWIICRYMKKNKKEELAIILGMLIAGITEPYLFNFSFKNLILLFMGNELFLALKEKKYRKITLLPCVKKKIILPVVDVETIKKDFQEEIKNLKAPCIALGIIVGVLAGIYTANTYDKPREIYVQNHRCDYVSGKGITRDEIEDVDSCWVLGYQNEETRFYGFSGNMITLEYFRGIITNIVFGSCFGVVVTLGVSGIQSEIRNRRTRK